MNSTTQSDFSQLSSPFINYSRSYSNKIQSCLLSREELKDLYKILVKKANEAAELQLNLAPNPSPHIKDAFKSFKDKLWVQIWGDNNEYINGDHESVFDDERLPKRILRISFNSYYGYQLAAQNKMQNWFDIQFDFKKTRIFDFSRITDPVNQNNSYYNIQGGNETWVDGAYQAINLFLTDKDKKLKRNWLHSYYTYDVLLYLIFFPVIFIAAYEIQPFLNISNLIVPLTVGISIYILIIFLYAFRILFNYSKWIFPIIELKNGSSTIHRGIFLVIILGIIASAAYDGIKWLGHLF